MADDLLKEFTDCVYEDLRKDVAAADQIMKNAAPGWRDLKSGSGAGLAKDSTAQRPSVVVYSDSKDPDVFQTAQTRRNGRPRGSRNGSPLPLVDYANGVDLVNISNGPKSGGSRRRTPMPTAGWFDDAADQVQRLLER